MTAHLINNNQLILLGGVQVSHTYDESNVTPAVIIVSLVDKTWRNINMEV